MYPNSKDYKQLKVPPNLHKKLKTLAVKKGITVIKLLEDLIKINI